MHRTVRRPAIPLVLALVLGCAGEGPGSGVLVISTAGDADILFPPVVRQSQAREITELVFDRLADLGPGLNTIGDAGWVPKLAQRWEWSADSSSVTFHLDPRARWHDGKPVSAGDVRFAYEVYTDRAVGSAGGADIAENVDSITVRDSATCTAWFRGRSPERFFQLVYTLAPLPAHLLANVPHDSLRASAFARAPVGNGPFKFVRWEPKVRLEIAANPAYHLGRPTLDRVIWSITPEGRTASERVIAGEADFIENITLAEIEALKKNPDVRAVPLPVISFFFLIFNQHDGPSDKPHPIFNDRNVRRALTMAMDKPAVVKNILDTLGRVAGGHFSHFQWSADTTLRQLSFNRAGAAALLDSAGWKPGPDGIRVKGGKKLQFSILVQVSSQVRVRLATILQEQWKQVGAQLDVEKLDNATLAARANGKRFDAVTLGLTSSPSPSGIRQTWSTAAIAMANGFNVGRYSNPVVDAQIDSARAASSVTAAKTHYRAAYQQLLDDAPGIWLYEPVYVGAASRRVTLGPMRADAFWLSLPSWRVSGGGKVPADAAPKP